VPRRKLSPRRQEYEATFPTATARIPGEVKAKLAELLRAEDLNFSEWVQARVAGSGAQTTAAYRRGQAEGRKQGDAEGYRRGRAEGEEVARVAGFRAGVLASIFAEHEGRSYDPASIVRSLADDPRQAAIADRLIPAEFSMHLARLRARLRR
jgi:flagellar biosynthesis/type III secretory pathway protein FliH